MIRAALLWTVWASSVQAQGLSCVDVKMGDEQYYNCINRELQQYTTGRRASALDAPGLDQSGPALGVFNQAAERERLGTAFGHSLVPQRAPHTFAPPALGHPQ